MTPYTLSTKLLKIAELCEGLATGLKAFLKAGYTIASSTWVNTDPDAHMAVSHHLSRLRTQYPQLFPPEATQGSDSRLPMDIRSISPEFFTDVIHEGADIILTSPPMIAQHLSMAHRGNTRWGEGAPQRLAQLIQYLNEAQSRGLGFIWDTTKLQLLTPHAASLLGWGFFIEAPKCRLGAYHNTRI